MSVCQRDLYQLRLSRRHPASPNIFTIRFSPFIENSAGAVPETTTTLLSGKATLPIFLSWAIRPAPHRYTYWQYSAGSSFAWLGRHQRRSIHHPSFCWTDRPLFIHSECSWLARSVGPRPTIRTGRRLRSSTTLRRRRVLARKGQHKSKSPA